MVAVGRVTLRRACQYHYLTSRYSTLPHSVLYWGTILWDKIYECPYKLTVHALVDGCQFFYYKTYGLFYSAFAPSEDSDQQGTLWVAKEPKCRQVDSVDSG